MNSKRITGMVACLVGIVLIIYAVHSMSVISEAKSEVKNMSNQMSGNYVGRRISDDLQSHASQYDTEVKIGLYSGIALVVIGAGLIFFCKKKKK
jgi:uncharacterized protein YjeT (DUF2065 family)